jgi:hypothetical protein
MTAVNRRHDEEGEAMKATNKAMTECWTCAHRREVPGNAHIRCSNPDPAMQGDPHGTKNGWFFYPIVFDPTWKTKECANFEEKAKA